MVASIITFLSALALTSSVIISPTVAIRGCAAGCGKSHQIGYSNNGGVGFPFGNRTYAVLVPMNYDSTRRYALIVDFHGHSGTSDRQHLTSQYDKFDANGDFLVVYPQGLKYPKENGVSAWEGPAYADPTVDDKAFIADLVRYLPQKYCIDEDRIYASGKSNGGGFVGTLACSSQGSAFAAFALHSSALYTDNLGAGSTNRVCTPSRAVLPIIQVHGSADRTVKYTGGQGSGGLTPPIPAWLDTWAERNGATSKNVDFPSSAFGERVNITTYYAEGASNAVVEGVWIKDMDHCWASVEENSDWTAASGGSEAMCKAPLNSTELFLEFFNKWDLKGLRETTP